MSQVKSTHSSHAVWAPALVPAIIVTIIVSAAAQPGATTKTGVPAEVLKGLRDFYQKTARPDGSFAPGVDPAYEGMSDCAYSDLAAVTYAVTIHKTFGWTLPHEKKTIEFLLSRQKKSGEFVNVKGTVDPGTAEGKTYNTTQALVALHALGATPKFDPLPVFDEILTKHDLKALPPYMSSFFPLAYLCCDKKIPAKLDQAIRATMIQDDTGYLNNHIAATFHASHYYQLVGEPTPKAHEMVARILQDQKANGSWALHLPARDRHATFDAVFTLVHEGHGSAKCQAAIARTVEWVLSCRNADGGFGHFPGSTSDADAIYFHVGTLVMGGFLKPADPLPKAPHLLSWGHLMPVAPPRFALEKAAFHSGDGWVGSVAFNMDGDTLALGSAGGTIGFRDLKGNKAPTVIKAHADAVVALQFSPDRQRLASGSFDHTASIWNAATHKLKHTLKGHQGAVTAVAFSPKQELLATASIDRTIRLWNPEGGGHLKTLTGHLSWVNAIAFAPDGKLLVSASSDGTVRVWDMPQGEMAKAIPASKAEVRSIAVSPNGKFVAAGIRYGMIKVWETKTWSEKLSFQGHTGDVWAIAFSKDSKLILSGNGDWNRPGQVKVWHADSGKLAGELKHSGEVLCLALSPSGPLVAAGGGDNVARVWDIAALFDKK